MTTVTRPIRFEAKGRRKRAVVGDAPKAAEASTVCRVPRVARLMALAIRYDQLLRDGVVASQSELARLAHVTQPRMTQIMNLLHLAPDIQEAILNMQQVAVGRDGLAERDLRSLAAIVDWRKQRAEWATVDPSRRARMPAPARPCESDRALHSRAM